MQVDLGGLDRLVAEPERDDAAVDAALEQLHGGRVPQGVRRDPFGAEGRTAWLRGSDVLGHEPLDGIVTQASAARAGEYRSVGVWWAFAQPGVEDLRDLGTQGRAAELAPFAVATDVSAAAQRHVLAAQGGQLGDAQAGLDGDEQERMVAPSPIQVMVSAGASRSASISCRRGIRRSPARSACSGSRGPAGKGVRGPAP